MPSSDTSATDAADLVLLVMNRRGVDALLNSKIKLGRDASAAAGPKGRNIQQWTPKLPPSSEYIAGAPHGPWKSLPVRQDIARDDDDTLRLFE